MTGDSPADAGAVSEHTPGALLMHIGPAPWNLYHHLGDIDPGPDHGLGPTRCDDAGVHIDPGVRVDKVLITF